MQTKSLYLLGFVYVYEEEMRGEGGYVDRDYKPSKSVN